MARSNYDTALARLLAHEGGYTDHPSDPGGPTNFGITIHDYRRYVKPRATAADVKAMRLDEAKEIYRAKYWNALRCDDLPSGVDYAVFDYGVNSGTGRAGKVLRRALKLDDGISVVADAVVAAACAADTMALVRSICDERLRFLQSLKTWRVFGKGWARRVAEVRTAALAMAEGRVDARTTGAASGRAIVPVPAAVQRVAVSAIAAGGAAVVHQTYQIGAGAAAVVAAVLAAIALACVSAWFWRWRRQRQQERQA